MSPPWNARRQHSGGSISVWRTRNMHRIKKNWAGYIAKKRQRVSLWWACGTARRGALRASRVVAEGWVMRANSRGVIFQARLYRLWLSAIRPAVSNAWPNERSVWCDWSGYRIISRIPLRALFFARHKAAHFGNDVDPFELLYSLNLYQFDLLFFAKADVVLWSLYILDLRCISVWYIVYLYILYINLYILYINTIYILF